MLRPFFRASVPILGGHSQVASLLSFLAIYFSASSASVLILSLPPGASASPARQRCAQAAAAIGFAVRAAKVHQALRPPRAKSAPLSPQSPAPSPDTFSNRFGNLAIAHRLIVERAVRLDVCQRRAKAGRNPGQRPNLFEYGICDCLARKL